MNSKKADINGLILVFRMVRESLGYFADKFDLTLTEMGIVFDISYNKQMSLKDVCESQGLPKSSVSRLVDGLVKRGIVDRKVPDDNRRMVCLTITKKYQKLFNDLENDEAFQKTLSRNIPSDKGRMAVEKLSELLAIIRE